MWNSFAFKYTEGYLCFPPRAGQVVDSKFPGEVIGSRGACTDPWKSADLWLGSAWNEGWVRD